MSKKCLVITINNRTPHPLTRTGNVSADARGLPVTIAPGKSANVTVYQDNGDGMTDAEKDALPSGYVNYFHPFDDKNWVCIYWKLAKLHRSLEVRDSGKPSRFVVSPPSATSVGLAPDMIYTGVGISSNPNYPVARVAPSEKSNPVQIGGVCPCDSSVSNRACLIAIIDKWMAPAGKQKPVPGWKRTGPETSCGDTVQWLLSREWGSKEDPRSLAFGIAITYKIGQGRMPRPGDVFVLYPKGKEKERAHVGFVYQVRGSHDDFEWRSAEGGQGAGGDLMWISPNWRGMYSATSDLLGWRDLDTIARDRARCKGRPKK